MRSQIMKRNGFIVSTILTILPLCASAGWQVATPHSTIPREPFFQATAPSSRVAVKKACVPAAYSSTAFPNQYATLGHSAPVYAVSICGSLKENLERIMGRYHWKVIWKAPYDYNFDGRVTGGSLPMVVEKLLKPFPLQAVMYMSNRTVAIVPRTLTGR